MTADQMCEIRRRLEEQLASLRSSRFDMASQACADENEFASMVAEAHFKVAMQGRVSHRIREIQTALNKMDSAGWGLCRECGEEIGRVRLMARPTAELCVDCQEELESRPAS